MWLHSLRDARKAQTPRTARRLPAVPALERLEDRTVPATILVTNRLDSGSCSLLDALDLHDDSHIHQYAQRIHEAVDTLETRLASSTDRVMSMQQEYGDMAREEVRAHPLAAVGVAFAAGFILAKLLR